MKYLCHKSDLECFCLFDGYNFVGNMDTNSHFHVWSYCTTKDERVSPYGRGSINKYSGTSITGLRGHLGGGCEEVSLSRAEYNPDIPLGDMITAVDSCLILIH